MILYAHRGNINGPNSNEENKPSYILSAINEGFHVEIDIYYLDEKYYLGHDEPQYEIDEYFLENPKLICHAKNSEAFLKMRKNPNIHCFWNDLDLYAVTSNSFYWTLDSDPPKGYKNLIFCKPNLKEISKFWVNKFFGYCSDYVGLFK
tara:strand:+ start:23945 stop:24388 length:444 start_codon:yes stop_codon:yes gene_type:complete